MEFCQTVILFNIVLVVYQNICGRLNDVIKYGFPLSLNEDKMDKLQCAKCFPNFNLRKGFFHVSEFEESRKFTAHVRPFSLYKYAVHLAYATIQSFSCNLYLMFWMEWSTTFRSKSRAH